MIRFDILFGDQGGFDTSRIDGIEKGLRDGFVDPNPSNPETMVPPAVGYIVGGTVISRSGVSALVVDS
jgi:hypothetical protein